MSKSGGVKRTSCAFGGNLMNEVHSAELSADFVIFWTLMFDICHLNRLPVNINPSNNVIIGFPSSLCLLNCSLPRSQAENDPS